MQRILTLLSAGACAGALVSLPAPAQTAADVSLTRLECGTPAAPTPDGAAAPGAAKIDRDAVISYSETEPAGPLVPGNTTEVGG